MKRVASLLVVAACGDGLSLDVQVRHPAEAAVASTAVSIHESSSATCKQIELGDLSTAELQAILVAERTGAGAIDGISRLGRKLVVARGFDAAGRYLTAGCTEHEEIAGHDVVTVDADFTATLSISALSPGELTIPITLTDADGRALGGHAITWRVYGPDGATPGTTGATLAPAEDGSWELAASTCTNNVGIARVHPVPPSRVGGYAIALRPSWPAQPSTLLTSFTGVAPAPEPVTPRPGVLRPCAIRTAGATRRLVCLQLSGTTPVVREYDVAVASGNAQLLARATVPIDPRAIALFSIERGATVRDVYAVTTDAQVLGVLGPSVAPAPGANLPAGSVATDAVLLPACEAGQAAQLVLRVATTMDKSLQVMPALGGPVTAYHGISTDPAPQLVVRDTGCVTELRPNASSEARRRQAAIVDVGQRLMPAARASTSVVFECDLQDQTRCLVSLPVSETGAGLSPPPRVAAPAGAPVEEPRLTGMYFDASGVIMSSWVLLSIQGQFQLVERERVPSAAIPGTVVSGHFDGDGLTDMLWDLQNAARLTSNLQVTYGRTIGAQRLSALSGAESILADAMLAGELTGDGVDDLVLFGRRRRDDGTLEDGVVVVPMNVPIPNPDVGFDQPCP